MSSLVFIFFSLAAGDEFYLQAEIFLFPFAGAEVGSFMVTHFKVSALNVELDFKIDLIVFGLDLGKLNPSALDNQGLSTLGIDTLVSLAEDFTKTRSFSQDWRDPHVYLSHGDLDPFTILALSLPTTTFSSLASVMSTFSSVISLSSKDTSSLSHSYASATRPWFLTCEDSDIEAPKLRRSNLALTLLYLASKSLVGLSSVTNNVNNANANGNGNGNGANCGNNEGCTYKEFLACKPKDFDGKGSAIVRGLEAAFGKKWEEYKVGALTDEAVRNNGNQARGRAFSVNVIEAHQDPNVVTVIIEYFVKISKKAHILELKQRNLNNTILTSNMPYPSRKIRFMMDDPNITMEEYIKLQAEKLEGVERRLIGKLLYTVEGYIEENVQDFEQRLDMIFGRQGQELFTDNAWRRLFEIWGPLVWLFMLEFFSISTCRISDAELGLDVNDTLLRERSIIKGILGITRLRFHLIGTFWGPAPSYTFIQDPVRRLCHTLISYSISGRGQAPKKGRKNGARMSEGYFIGRLAEHFGLVSDEGLMGLSAWVASGPERHLDAAASAPEVAKGAPNVDEGCREEVPCVSEEVWQKVHSIEEMVEDRFEAYWVGSTRVILDKGDLGDYWTAISSDRDFLGDAPTYTYIKDPHGARDGECPVPIGIVFFRHAEWRKSGARLSGDTLLGILLLTLAWLDETWAWVAPGPEGQPVDVTGSLEVAEGAPNVDEDRLSRLEEEVHSLRGDMGEQREVLDSMIHDFARFTTWTRRRVRQRTGEASTSATPLDEDQPDP
ncbi:hypothetical protein Tco_0481713 [Tanacetum coccineum]